ncbi:MAG: DUF488 family protein [Bacilli bacterium]|nr:DUF488 family protein [Bacilli bacterium]MDD4407176.1 DUF488 family protein [Bacilli bacterium]
MIKKLDINTKDNNKLLNNVVIGTSNYINFSNRKLPGNIVPVSISGDGGSGAGFRGLSFKKLAPSLDLYTYYKNNPDKLTNEELIEYYIKEYFNHRLKNSNGNEIIEALKSKFGGNLVLLCYEDIFEFCHRRLVADFISITNNIEIPELIFYPNGNVLFQEAKDYKPQIKKLIKRNYK